LVIDWWSCNRTEVSNTNNFSFFAIFFLMKLKENICFLRKYKLGYLHPNVYINSELTF